MVKEIHSLDTVMTLAAVNMETKLEVGQEVQALKTLMKILEDILNSNSMDKEKTLTSNNITPRFLMSHLHRDLVLNKKVQDLGLDL